MKYSAATALLQTVPVLCAGKQSQSVNIVINAAANLCVETVHCMLENETPHLQN